MLTFRSSTGARHCDGLSRRSFLQVGALGIGGLTLPMLLRQQAAAAEATGAMPAKKAIIMVYLNGGPSHMDMFDLKPKAPSEYRGEFAPIETTVPGIQICEHLPKLAALGKHLAIIRSMKFKQQGHTAPELYTGFLQGNRPAIGSVVSKLRSQSGVVADMPPNIYLGDANHVGHPGFLGKAHEAYIPTSSSGRKENIALDRGMSLERLNDRRALRKQLDNLRREIDDPRGSLSSLDAFTEQALAMITTDKARDAFDINKEPEHIRARYGKGTEYLLARRLVEAGVPVVTINPRNFNVPQKINGQWDHHDYIFEGLRLVLPQFDQSLSALITDLVERGLDKDVGVCVWGEMGRTPRVGTQNGTTGGRDHWPQSGFCLLSGGGLRTGQVIGATDRHGEEPATDPYTPQNVLATLYHILGIDPRNTLNDLSGRPIYLLDDQRKVKELV